MNVLAEAVAQEFTATLKPLQANDRTLLAAVNSLSGYVSRLNEQMQQQWWVVAGWSGGAAKPFRELARIMREGAVEGKTQEPPCGTNVVHTTF